MNNCYLCESVLTENDHVLCTMNCDHTLCQICFLEKIKLNTFTCSLCGSFTENVISKLGNNLIITTPIEIGTCQIDKHCDQWMEIWKELTKKDNKN